MESSLLVVPYGFWKRQVLLGLPLLAFIAVFIWQTAHADGLYFYLVLSLFALCLSIFGETEFSSKQSAIIRCWRLLKIIPLRRKQYSVSDFTSIGARFTDDSDCGRMWYVNLRRKNGTRLDIKWFGYANELPPEAKLLQSRLSDITGLPIKNEIH